MRTRRLLGLVLSVLLLPATGCERTFVDDLFDIHREIDLLKESHGDMQRRLDNLNETAVTLQAIIDVLSSGYYVDRIDPIVENGVEKGYLFHFTNDREITVLHGLDGVDGHTPLLGVTQVEGKYYWTLDGQLLQDDEGTPVPVLSDTFTSPRFSISNGYWYLSIDGGATWRLLGQATGEDGQYGADGVQHFIRVDPDSYENMVVFVLADGTVLSIPRRPDIRLILDSADEAVSIAERETVQVGYRLTSATANTVVSVSSDGYYTAKVIPQDAQSGVISITCPRTYADGVVNVMVFEDAGIVDSHIIRFYEKSMTFPQGLEFQVAPEGGSVLVPYEVNFPYHLEVDELADAWLEVAEMGTGTSGYIDIQADPNEGVSRTGTVYIVPDNGEQVYEALFVTQQSADCTMDKGSFVLPFEGGTALCNVVTEEQFQVLVPETDSEWLQAEILLFEEKAYTVAITAEPNAAPESRSAVIDLVSREGRPIASVQVLQQGRNLDLEYAMVFIVNPNYSNDFTVYLPIDINSGFDCFVDWGDGTGMRYRKEDDFNAYPEGERNVHHRYEGLTVGRKFEVVVSGTVTSLRASVIPLAYRSSVTEVKQWGKTGLTKMNRAFQGFSALTTLPPDETGAFEDVESFEYAFAECANLTTVSGHLFDHARSATSFSGTFSQCPQLMVLPENLFSQAVSATNFNRTFEHDRRLTKVPGGLFAHCPEVESFTYTFYGCESLQAVPSNLFSGSPKVTSFSGIFMDCRSLTSIPEGLFDGNPEVTSFYRTFENCLSLASVPSSLLDHQRRITDCSLMFRNCRGLRSESPWMLVDGAKAHLYERHLYPDVFVFPGSHDQCFSGCPGLPDRALIPDSWK